MPETSLGIQAPQTWEKYGYSSSDKTELPSQYWNSSVWTKPCLTQVRAHMFRSSNSKKKYFDQHSRILFCFGFSSTSRNIFSTYFHFQARLLCQICTRQTFLCTRIIFNSLRIKGKIKKKVLLKPTLTLNLILVHPSFGFTLIPVTNSHRCNHFPVSLTYTTYNIHLVPGLTLS